MKIEFDIETACHPILMVAKIAGGVWVFIKATDYLNKLI